MRYFAVLFLVAVAAARDDSKGYFTSEPVAIQWLNDYLAALNDCSAKGKMTKEFGNFFAPTFQMVTSTNGTATNLAELDQLMSRWTPIPYTMVATGEIVSSVGGELSWPRW
eukprot:m.276977 g.276977  ORF g.276977 m.276977 type:complete len:111 (-) comp85538_c0_seq1:650-982(-)